MYTLGIITSSDKGYAGEREDGSGKVIKEIAEANGSWSKGNVKRAIYKNEWWIRS